MFNLICETAYRIALAFLREMIIVLQNINSTPKSNHYNFYDVLGEMLIILPIA